MTFSQIPCVSPSGLPHSGWLTNNRIHLSHFWRLGSSRPRHQHSAVMMKAPFLVHSQYLVTVPSDGRKGKGALWVFFIMAVVSFYKGMNHLLKGQEDWCRDEKRGLYTERDTKEVTWRWRQRLEWCIYKPRNAKDYQQPPEAGYEAWDRASLRAFRRNQSFQHLDFRLLVFRTTRQ